MNVTKYLLAILICVALAAPVLAQNAPASGPGQGSSTTKINLDKSELYKAIDKNKDGCMSYEEWHGVGMPDSSWNMLNKDGCVTPKIMEDNGDPSTELDGNGDGKITLEEFLAFDKKMSAQMSTQGGSPQGGQGGAPGGAPQGAPAK